MKIVLAAIAVLGIILIRLLLSLPWGTRRSGVQRPARFNFLLIFGLVAIGIILVWFWFAMRAR